MTHTPGQAIEFYTAFMAGFEESNTFEEYIDYYEEEGTPRTEQLALLETADRLIAAAPALLEALEALSEAVKPTREGKRDGGTFGRLSIADDTARNAIALARGETVTT